MTADATTPSTGQPRAVHYDSQLGVEDSLLRVGGGHPAPFRYSPHLRHSPT